MDDILKAFKATLYDKISSPLVSSFCIAWSILNYEVILIIFSSDTVRNKILDIDLHFYKFNHFSSVPIIDEGIDFNMPLYGQLIVPFLFASFYVLLFPVVEKYFIRRWNHLRNINEKERILAQNKQPIDEDKAIILKQRYYDLERNKIFELESKDKEILSIKSKYDELLQESEELRSFKRSYNDLKPLHDSLQKIVNDLKDDKLKLQNDLTHADESISALNEEILEKDTHIKDLMDTIKLDKDPTNINMYIPNELLNFFTNNDIESYKKISDEMTKKLLNPNSAVNYRSLNEMLSRNVDKDSRRQFFMNTLTKDKRFHIQGDSIFLTEAGQKYAFLNDM
ncbi:hypothetical protein [Shewanella dokdonensis]|uniref:Uncharacterized protein n=1 Tax=Shewanella dokdonensis TaxID=712036 RepID=A0ABX8DEM1_9GAMM|nr:hypothetical protein [Shewanella dokdonensis]MCL1072998.1 hypothetical protein [Shewanella dokdonensis]QVK23086.1 hypothetical protein KHX94_18640 [Shewanella dokdonensis]